MKKNSFMKYIAVGLAATLTLAGCGSSGGGVIASGGTGTGGSGGSGSATGVTGTDGMGLTGATLPTTGGSGGGTIGGGTGGSGGTTPTTDGSTDGGTDDGGTSPTDPVADFTKAVSQRGSITTTSPSQMAVLGGRLYFISFAGQTSTESRLMSAPITGTGATLSVGTPVPVTAAMPGSSEVAELVSPFGLVADDNSLYISVGCNPATDVLGNGKIVKVSNITVGGGGSVSGIFTNLTSAVTPLPSNPAFMFVNSGRLYWSQYSASAGQVRSVPTGGGSASMLVDGLSFPTGIDTDGTNIVIAHSGNNEILKMPLAGGATTVIDAPVSGGIQRPFDVEYDGNHGFFITQGTALNIAQATSDPLPLLYLPKSSEASRTAVAGVARAAGIDAADLGGGKVGLLYAEGNPGEGRVMRAVYDTGSSSSVVPTQISTSATFIPFSVMVIDQTTPSFLSLENFFSPATNQGRLHLYRP